MMETRPETEPLPDALTLELAKVADLRYGENPHQRGALYREPGQHGGVATATLLHGLPMSFLNYVDADAAWQAVWDFAEPTCAVVKHATPCGLASRSEVVEAYRLALAGDPVSAYGGIVAVNRPVDVTLAHAIRHTRNPRSGQRQLLHVVVAPAYTAEGLGILKGKSNDLRILQAPPPPTAGLRVRQISGGWLVQDADVVSQEELTFVQVSRRPPTPAEAVDLAFAWKACRHITSNAIALAKDQALVGMGAGQPNRVGSVRLALEVAGERADGGVLASDAYFPFADGIEVAARAGVTAVVQPGGSIRDADVIDAANRQGLALVIAPRRHFRHG